MLYKDHLESPRLTTRFLTKEDEEPWMEYCSDPVATRFTGIPGKTPTELARFMIEVGMKRYAEGRLGPQVLLSKETGEMVGMCALLVQEPNGKREIEVGYHLLRRFWGKGYATEAAKLLRDYGFENGDMDSIISIIDPLNVASQAVALRNGMRLSEREVEFKGNTYDIYRITRTEWEQLKTGPQGA